MYIYSPILDLTTLLLRVVPIDRTSARALSVFAEFNHAHYVPLGTTRCSIFQILIHNEAGEEMKFTFGKVVVSLHFLPIFDNIRGMMV